MTGFNLKIVSVVCILFIAIVAKSQISNIDQLSLPQLKKFGANAKRAGDKHTAIFFYERYLQLRSSDVNMKYELANLHREVRNYEKARVLYEQVFEKAPKKYPLAEFYYAKMLKSTGNYDEAIEVFDNFRKGMRGQKKYYDYRKLARAEIRGCDSAKVILENPLNLTIENLNSTVNSPHIELSPMPVNDTSFIYASLRVDSLVYFTSENEDSKMPVRQFYLATKQDLDWIGGEPLAEPINIPGVETGNGVLSRDGNRFYFSRCEKNWQGKMICSIYLTKKENNEWSKPGKLPPIINDPNYTSSQPALGRTAKGDMEILFYVTDREDGKGGMDIWYTVWSEEKQLYSKPRNLGRRVNTGSDEMTPYFDLPRRTLYFSSNGHPGMGGFDVFKTLGERRKWTKVKNAGYPINTSYDDLYFTVSKTGEYGFLVSNRPGTGSVEGATCCDDIFHYRWNDYIRITVTGTIYPFEKDKYGRKQDLSNFDFMNPDESIEPLENAVIALYMKDKESDEYIFMDRYTTGKNGKFYFTLQPDQEYEFKMEGFQYFDSKNYLSTEFMNFSDTLPMPPIWVNVLSDKPVVLENIYYEFNSAELSNQAKEILDTTLLVMMTEAPEFIVEIGAHTDSIGSYEFNQKLSQDRANGVVEYLISKGISENRLVAKGYGALVPVAPNYLPDGSDNPEGREKNRRTEFRVIGTIGDKDEDEETFDSY